MKRGFSRTLRSVSGALTGGQPVWSSVRRQETIDNEQTIAAPAADGGGPGMIERVYHGSSCHDRKHQA
jgi:hypothetical protein